MKLAQEARISEELACSMIVNSLPPNIKAQGNNPVPTNYKTLELIGITAESTVKELHKQQKINKFKHPSKYNQRTQQFKRFNNKSTNDQIKFNQKNRISKV